MKQYKVIILSEAQRDLEKRIDYIVYVLKNKQAAKSVMLDYNNTIKMLSNIAERIHAKSFIKTRYSNSVVI